MKKIIQKQLCFDLRKNYRALYPGYFAIRKISESYRKELAKTMWIGEDHNFQMFQFEFSTINYSISEFPTEHLYKAKKAHILP